MAFVYREEVYKRDHEHLRGLAELIVAKQRNGPVGKVELTFLKHLAKFENRAEDTCEEGPAMKIMSAGERLPYGNS